MSNHTLRPGSLPGLVLFLFSSTGPAPAVSALTASSSSIQVAAGQAKTPVAGTLGIGDPYVPGLGNGGYDVEHYDMVLDLDMASAELVAQVTLRAQALHELSSFSLDLYGLEVERVLVNGVEARFERPAPVTPVDKNGRPLKPSELVIHPAQPLATGASFEAEVTYFGVPDVRPDPGIPFLPGVGWMRSKSGIYVLSECIGASSWFPCNDHPCDKATYSFRVSVEKPYVVAANGLLLEKVEEGERRTYVFRASDPMATYLATIDVAEFGLIEDQGPRGIPVRIYHPLDASEEELRDFRRQPEVLGFLESVFGPYPFEAAGGVLSSEAIPGALECQTLPVYGRGSDLRVIVHELAHQWFGDCVSPALWRDMWLNEGFASYAEWLWAEHEGGSEGYERSVRGAYRSLRENRTGSPFDPGVERVFGERVYMRGAMVLHGLRSEVGAETFFRILKTWVDVHHGGNATTQDFVQHASRTAARDLSGFFAAWLYGAVTPELAALEAPDANPGEKSEK
jgi:aminopeptidase N